MRLAVFTNQFPSRISTFFSRDMRALLEAGIEIDIFPMRPLEPELWRYVPAILGESVLPRGKVHHTSLGQSLRSPRRWCLRKLGTFLRDTAAVSASAARFGFEPLAKSMYVFPKAWAWAQEYSADYDHIFGYWGSYAATCAYIAHRLMDRRVPFSLFLHAGADLYSNQVYLRQKLLYADNIIVCCDFNRQFIRAHYSDIFHRISDKLHVHYHGLDFAEFPYELNGRSQRRIVAVGSFDGTKGFDYLLGAVRELTLRRFEVELELVGDGHQEGSLRRLAKDLGIIDRVRFRGWLTVDEVKVAMREAAVLVHPSPRLADGLPNVIKEAMALGTPVVASDLAGIPEGLDGGRCGILVPPRNVRLLANTLQTLLGDADLRRKYAHAARTHAEEKFDLWKNGKRLANLLSSTRR